MKYFSIILTFVILNSCNLLTTKKSNVLSQQEFLALTDSISILMHKYIYNPKELASEDYINLEKEVKNLTNIVQTKKEFINGFNELWKDGPFSHIQLNIAERPATEMADFIDNLNMEGHAVSLEWADKTAILTLTSMTGVDTKDLVFDAFHQIEKRKPEFLIIDLRNNTGGTFAGVPLIGHILTDSVDVGMFVSQKWWQKHNKVPGKDDVMNLKSWKGWSIKTFWHDIQEEPLTRVRSTPMSPHFDGQVYVLVGNKTASAAEFTVDALAQSEQVTLIGDTTAGEMLSQKMFDLPYGFQLSLPIADYYSCRIGRIEGKGVKPDILIDQRVAMDVVHSLINGEKLEEALKKAQLKIEKLDELPFGGETIYLFGNMNDWGKNWNITPIFDYKGDGIYESSTTLKKGRYEFKIAPMNWDFDYGANSDQENVSIGMKYTLMKVPGSSNLIIEIEEESKLTFSLDVSDKVNATLLVTKSN